MFSCKVPFDSEIRDFSYLNLSFYYRLRLPSLPDPFLADPLKFRTKQLPTDPRLEEEEENKDEEDKGEAPLDISADVTVALDHLQLTSNNEKSAKTHGFKVLMCMIFGWRSSFGCLWIDVGD